jgi:leucyl-tRNA synthetase
MEYNFREIEKKWQKKWKDDKVYEVPNESPKPKYYVLDMFPYPSGAGLHVGHPLGYIASDIYSRYKRLKGFNVLHPMGFDSFGLPAEQYALETGQHPAVTTEKNIETFKAQLDKIGFCYDWSREVRTSDPSYYKWTQKIFLELFNSYFCSTQQKARPIADLIEKYKTKGNSHFSAEQWNAFTKPEQEVILMKRRLAFSSFGEVNWCEALGTVLANDEVVNGVSERGGHPVIKKKMRQWYLRITAYADRLLQGLETVNFSEPMKEMQRNWIGRSEGAEILFPVPSPQVEKGEAETAAKMEAKGAALAPKYSVSSPMHYELAKKNRKDFTDAEDALWQALRGSQLGAKIRRQHPIDAFIVDFVSLQDGLIIEADGGYHENEEQKLYDENRTRILNEIGFTVIRFTNDEILKNIEDVKQKIKAELKNSPKNVQTPTHKEEAKGSEFSHPSTRSGEGTGVRSGQGLRCYTTRPETIFGVDFLVLAPEHSLVAQITTEAEKEKIEEYLTYVKSRSDRERMSEVKQITGCFTGAYATNPFNGKQIPVWIAEYVLAGYGTGAIMAVPCGDQRDFAFAQHFNIPITNIIGEHYNGTEANATKEATLQNSDFLNGMLMKDAIGVAINKIEELGIGKRKVNYRMRDAGFSRQRYWGEPFPIVWQDETAIALSETDLPVLLPHAEKYGPGPEGEGPLANMVDWVNLTPASPEERSQENLTPNPSPKEREPLDQLEDGKEEKQYGYLNSTVQEWKKTFEFAKRNRKNLTEAEDKMWQLVRNRYIDNYKFRRQHPIAGFIPDFVCLERKLIIEIDGGYHNEEEQIIFDEARENWLKEFGFNIIRFTNEQVLENISNIKKAISERLQELKEKAESSPAPLPWRGGGEVSLRRETSTMPGYAGSSWYFLRYMDPHNTQTFCDRKASDYWNQVDVYVGGTEHAVGHLLYSRMWTKVLYDLGYIGFEEPFKKLVNQGMIQGSSRFVYRVYVKNISTLESYLPLYVTKSFYESFNNNEIKYEFFIELINSTLNTNIRIENIKELKILPIHVDVKLVNGIILDEEAFRKSKPEYLMAKFILDEDGKYICGAEVEKMSKSKYNTVNPDELCMQYGADTFRMYEMFLGPVEQSKPWDTKGIEGVHRFLKKLWRLFYTEPAPSPSPLVERGRGEVKWTDEKPNDAEYKILHKTIKKIEQDTENFSYNTAVAAFMISVNELADAKCYKKEILSQILILLTPYAPHIAEELWAALGCEGSILDANYPTLNESYLVEATKEYPVSINGKMRSSVNLPTEATEEEARAAVLSNEVILKWMEGAEVKKFIFVKGRMINVVV